MKKLFIFPILFFLFFNFVFTQEQFNSLSQFKLTPFYSIQENGFFKYIFSGTGGYLKFTLNYENIRPSFKFTNSSYRGLSFRESKTYIKDITVFLGNESDGALFSTGYFMPLYDRDSYLTKLEDEEEKIYRDEIFSSLGSRYVQFYFYYSLSEPLKVGAGYGRVFGEQTLRESYSLSGKEQSFYYLREKIKGYYIFFTAEAQLSRWFRLSSIIPVDFHGNYIKYYLDETSEEEFEGELTYRLPKILRADIYIKESNIYYEFLFYTRAHKLICDGEEKSFLSVDSSKSHIMKLGLNLKTKFSIVPYFGVSASKYRYWILDNESNNPRFYEFSGVFLFNLGKFIMKAEYDYLYSKVNYTFYSGESEVRLYYDRFIVSFLFPFL